MAEIKVYLSDELDKRFRKTAMITYGYGRGSISKAAADAFLTWCRIHENADETSTSVGSAKEANNETPDLSKEERTPNSLASS